MAFEEIKENAAQVQENAKAYVETTLAYYELKGFKVIMKSTTLFVKVMLISVCLMLVLFFVSVAGALALGKYLESYPLGFLIVGGMYLILAFVMLLIKDKLVEGQVLEKFSEIFFND